MKIDELLTIAKEEIEQFFKEHPYSAEEEMLLETEILIGELLDPNMAYPYKGEKGLYTYEDVGGDTFFVRAHYVPPPSNYLELKTGWFNKDGKPQYEPPAPPHSKNSSAVYVTKRSDTVAKIYRDEILPFFEKQDLTDLLGIKPISSSRMKFAERLVRKFTPEDKFEIEYGSPLIIKKKE